MSYNVVFEGTGEKNSNFAGIRTWTQFKSQEEYQSWNARVSNRDTVVAEGVTENEAMRLTAQTNGEARARAVLTARRNGEPLKFVFTNARFAAEHDGHLFQFAQEIVRIVVELKANKDPLVDEFINLLHDQ